MPLKRKSAAPASSRPNRATKTKPSDTIHQAIGRRGRQMGLIASPGAVVNPSVDPSALGAVLKTLPQLQGIEKRFQALETSLNENQTTFRSTLNDTFDQIMDRFDTMEPRPPVVPGPAPSVPDLLLAQNINPLGDPHNVLAHFFWVQRSVVQTIADGEFDIHDLPKLHREEEQRMSHNRKVTEGVHFPVDGGKPELVIGRTKMQSAFKDLATFLSAWMVYVSIRSTFAPERAPALAYWTERVVFYAQSGFQWSVVLNYAIAYFSAHQKSPVDTWYSVNTDHKLAMHHFTIAHKTSISDKLDHRPISFLRQ